MRSAVLVMGCVLLSGCYTMQRRPALPLEVRLETTTEFQVVPAASMPPSADACLIRRADFLVSGLVGDTLHFLRMRILTQPAGAPSCGYAGPGRLVLSEYPDVIASRAKQNGALTWAAIIWGTAGTLALAMFLVLPFGLST